MWTVIRNPGNAYLGDYSSYEWAKGVAFQDALKYHGKEPDEMIEVQVDHNWALECRDGSGLRYSIKQKPQPQEVVESH